MIPRHEDSADSAGPIIERQRLPEEMRQRLVDLELDRDIPGLDALVDDGRIPTDPVAVQAVAEWLLKVDHPEPLAFIKPERIRLNPSQLTAETLESFLSNATHLRDLTLTAEPEAGHATARAIELALQSESLKSLALRHVGAPELMALLVALPQNTSLETLKLGGRRMAGDLVFGEQEALAKVLHQHKSLTALSIRHCDGSATNDVLRLLHRNSGLRSLEMTDLVFAPAGTGAPWYQAVASMLSVNTTLARLRLDDNYVDDHDLEVIGCGMRDNLSLRELGLGGRGTNPLPERFVELVGENLSLTTLVIGLPATARQKEAIEAHMLANKIREIQYNMGVMEVVGGAFGRTFGRTAGLPVDETAHAARLIARRVASSSTADEVWQQRGPALARVNKATGEAAASWRLEALQKEILTMLAAEDDAGIEKTLRAALAAGVKKLDLAMHLLNAAVGNPRRPTLATLIDDTLLRDPVSRPAPAPGSSV